MSTQYIVGLHALVSDLKSVVIAFPTLRHLISPMVWLYTFANLLQRAVQLANMEELEQRKRWGEIPGVHDVEMASIVAKVSADVLFLSMMDKKENLLVHKRK
jgi:hypothetical protein